ncbi:MAG: bifunctional UDP-3-O-[3-hydroxymyristoyl] N-acetylglucosamine deacetylase/3-hydroxyacyl-ACP dehydratase [Bacteroidota bacterium]
MTNKQRTISQQVTVSGVGLHTGEPVNLTFKPASENYGCKFQRVDLVEKPIINAVIENVVDTSRGTTIQQNNVIVATVEHVLAALSGLSIDNVHIDIDSAETPIMDGSSRYFVEALKSSGIVEQDEERNYYTLDTTLRYSNPAKNVEIIAIPSDEFKLSVLIDYNSSVIGSQHAILENIDDFCEDISKSRTFVFLHELELLISHNLIKGGDLNNAIVLVDKIVDQNELDRLAKVFNKPNIKVLEKGVLNNTELSYYNEPARHKLLDLIGDVSLVGVPLKAHIIATRPGHEANVEFTKILKAHIKKSAANKDIPVYDPNAKPIYDINQIKNILPHRPPFLLVDKIIEMDEHHIVGLKNVTMNEAHFVGHFPNEPVMPGVLQIEAMAQAGGIYTLSKVPDPENYVTYFLKIDNARFKQKVVPGDTLIFKLQLVSPFRRGICHMFGTAYVGNKVVMEAELMAQIIKKK